MTPQRKEQLANTLVDVGNELCRPGGMKLSECRDIIYEVAQELRKSAEEEQK